MSREGRFFDLLLDHPSNPEEPPSFESAFETKVTSPGGSDEDQAGLIIIRVLQREYQALKC